MPTRSHRSPAPDRSSGHPDLDHLPVGVLVLDGTSAVYANDSWRHLTGQRGRRWAGAGWLHAVPVSVREVVGQDIESCARSNRTYEADWPVVHPLLGPRILHVSAVGEDEGPSVLVAADVTEERVRVEVLRHLAEHDELTGLRNRRQFAEFLDRAVARQRRADLLAAVVFVDVDDLKAVNDRHGHAAGDRLLVDVARRITGAVRPGDVVARWGGDEFVVLCEDLADAGEADAIAERIRRACRVRTHDGLGCSVSTGVALVAPASTTDELLRAADAAMYRTKRRRSPVA